MGITNETKMLGINNAKIYQLESDSSEGLTYKSAVNVPGITELSLTPTFIKKELKGDEKILDVYSKLESINWSFQNSIMSLDALAILEGGSVTKELEKVSHKLKGKDLPRFFMLRAKTDYTEHGDAHFILYKAKANDVSYRLEGEEYVVVSASGKAIPTIYNGNVKDIIFNSESEELPETITIVEE